MAVHRCSGGVTQGLPVATAGTAFWSQRRQCRPCTLLQRSHLSDHKRQRVSRPSCRGLARAALDPDNASVLVCGGGGVALLTASKLKDYGCWVWMMQRGDSRKSEIEQMGAILLRGDAMDTEGVEKVFSNVDDIDAVICTIGGTPANPLVDSQGNINLIDAAVRKGVKKFVLLTSIGTGNSKDAPPKQVYDVLKPVLLEKEKAENYLKELKSKMVYTIIRPGGLKSEPGTGSGVLTADTSVCGAIHREDVAGLLVKALFSSATDNKVLSAVDTSQLFGDPKFDTVSL